jgi:sigma-B regulation protein RsbU (phosphoserine phosphatase)
VLQHVNRQLLGMNNKGMFVTVLYGVLDQTTQAFSYARAGHELPIIRDRHGLPVSVPLAQGHPLALFPDPALDARTVVLPDGGSVLLYTDGVTEAINPQGDFFGLAQLHDTLLHMVDTSAQPLCDGLINLLAAYHATAPQSDDITVVAVKVR